MAQAGLCRASCTRVATSIACLLLAGAGASAGDAPALFEIAAAPASPRPLARNVLRHRYVRLNEGQLGAKVGLNLFDDVVLRADHRLTDTNALGGNVWVGVPEGGEGEVFLSRVGSVTVGNVWLEERMFELRYEAGGLHVITEIDPGSFSNERCGPVQPVAGVSPPAASVHGGIADPCGVIDVMVLYTPAALDSAGDAAAMEALIHMAFSAANLSLVDSDVNVRFSPVHIDEIDYTEAGTADPDADVFDDRDALRDTNDGEMDGAHALRDRYCADIVHLITDFSNQVNSDNEWCGGAYIQQSAPDPAHEASGFAVTIDSCAVGNRTFAHEMGHTLGAQHDWYADDTLDPWGYAHGYVNTAERWRTIMAYNSECEDSGLNCTRLGLWSNPNVDWLGDPAGVPDGTDTSCVVEDLGNPDCDAENWRVINDTRCTVANFRQRSQCAASSARNVWMKDTWFDTGMEPDPFTAGQKMWKSPAIWVRNDFDPTGEFQHLHQNPEFGGTDWVYVKLHNDFDVAATGQLRLYYAEAATGLQWPADWTEFASVPVNGIAAHGTLLQPASWQPPGVGHFCLLARWSAPTAPADPMTFAEGSSVKDNTRNNNNIVWRNVNIVNTFPDIQLQVPPFDMQNLGTASQFVTLAIELPNEPGNFLRAGGRLGIDLGDALEPWLDGGGAGSGIQVVDDPVFGTLVEVLDTSVARSTIDRLQLPPFQRVPMHLIVESPLVPFPPSFPPVDDDPADPAGPMADGQTIPDQPINAFAVDLVQVQGSDEVGGVGYEIHVTPTSDGAGAVPDGAGIPGIPLRVARLAAGLELSWSASCSTSDVDYAVHEGTLGDFTSHVPVECSTAGATTAVVPEPAHDAYYLIVPTDGAADGSYGTNSAGMERPESAAACRLRVLGVCP